jgi:group II intron reverse transcriptase/maturase
MMHGEEKSDRVVVPEKSPNKAVGTAAEGMEERTLAKGNAGEVGIHRTQSRERMNQRLARVREAARKDGKQRFTALMHHVYNLDTLAFAYWSLDRKSAPGIDGVTWQSYGEALEDNLQDLSVRLKRGGYRASAVRRVFIPKADGRQRPLGVPTLEDKIVQRALVEVMNAIYEIDFLGFSYGFRPGRSQHNALDAVSVGLERRKVNWVLDADIQGFFDTLNHDWLLRFVEHRIGDKRVTRLIRKWLIAGVVEDGVRTTCDQGTPQGGSISPLLANIYLHYVLDLWAQQWRHRQASGDMILVRYADDFIVGFQRRTDAERFLADLRERLAGFDLTLHPEKTRLIEFGRFARQDRERRGKGKPETFDFLGFTHICGKTRRGRFKVQRKTMRKRFQRVLLEVETTLRKRWHWPIPQIGKWLAAVVRGHVRYFGVPGNGPRLTAFRFAIGRLWYRALRRRSQNDQTSWARASRLIDLYLPKVRICHPYPNQRLHVTTQGRSPVR